MAEKVKKNVQHLGSSLTNSIGANVKNPFKHKSFDSDDELISHYEHDLQRSIKALKYILGQINRLANVGVPKLFKSNMKSVELFSKQIGANSLQFEGIDEYYRQFDALQAQQELAMVHPKEATFEIPALNEQLYNYLVTLDSLTSRILDDWDLFYQENKLRINEMIRYLKDSIKLIKKRNKRQYIYEKTHKKLEKLMKKTTPLDDKEQKKMIDLEKELKDAKYIYEKIDEKTRTILPHIYLLLEEFIDSISKIIFCKQVDTYKAIYQTMDYFTTFYGFISEKERNGNETYEAIIDTWENSMTPVKLQIETFISLIYDKNPELVDQEIDDNDKTLKASKMWNKMTTKMTTKTFELKPTDPKNGLFDGYLDADPINAFLEYQNPNSNVSETYFPSKKPTLPTVQVSDSKPGPAPPTLPPRGNTATTLLAPAATPRIGFPVSLPSSPVPSTPKSYNNTTMDSDNESFDSNSVMSDIDDDEDFEDEEISMSNSKSLSTFNLMDDKDKKNSKISKVYNSSKNDISTAPIYKMIDLPISVKPSVFEEASSITHKLDLINEYFNKINNLDTERQRLIAKYDFEAVEPGDLSFKAGETVEVIFTFYNLNKDVGNWLVGIINDGTITRMGLVPSNYF